MGDKLVMSERWVTTILLLLIGAVILADVLFWSRGGVTFSTVIRRSLSAHPMVPTLLGITVGHLVLSREQLEIPFLRFLLGVLLGPFVWP